MNSSSINAVITLISLAVYVFVIVDVVKNATRNRTLWIIVVVLFGLIGWLFFRLLKDRRDTV